MCNYFSVAIGSSKWPKSSTEIRYSGSTVYPVSKCPLVSSCPQVKHCMYEAKQRGHLTGNLVDNSSASMRVCLCANISSILDRFQEVSATKK